MAASMLGSPPVKHTKSDVGSENWMHPDLLATPSYSCISCGMRSLCRNCTQSDNPAMSVMSRIGKWSIVIWKILPSVYLTYAFDPRLRPTGTVHKSPRAPVSVFPSTWHPWICRNSRLAAASTWHDSQRVSRNLIKVGKLISKLESNAKQSYQRRRAAGSEIGWVPRARRTPRPICDTSATATKTLGWACFEIHCWAQTVTPALVSANVFPAVPLVSHEVLPMKSFLGGISKL